MALYIPGLDLPRGCDDCFFCDDSEISQCRLTGGLNSYEYWHNIRRDDCPLVPVSEPHGRLKEYEDAEEQGRLLKLPCKVGDTVYAITRKVISEFTVEHFDLYDSEIFVSWRCVKGFTGSFKIDGIPAREIGKTVFLTREEAEKALEGEA